MKKFLATLIIVCIAFTALIGLTACNNNEASEKKESDDYLLYTLKSDDTYEVFGADPSNTESKTVNVPATFNKKKVTSIKENAFKNVDWIKSVIISDNVTSIGASAFEGCINLTQVTLSENLTAIETRTFFGCVGLTEVELPAKLTEIKKFAFGNCTHLTRVNVGDNVTSIGANAFSGCEGVTEVNLGRGLKNLELRAFYGCRNLTTVKIYKQLEWVDHAFDGCNAISNIIFVGTQEEWNALIKRVSLLLNSEYTVTYVDDVAPDESQSDGEFNFRLMEDDTYRINSVKDNTKTSYSIPSTFNGKNVTSIYSMAFYNCAALTSIVIPNGIISIGQDAFYDCTSLVNVSIPATVTLIGNFAFEGCSALQNITVADGNQNYKSVDGNLYNKNGTEIVQYAVGKTATSFNVPDGVTTICEEAFWKAVNLESVTLPDSVTEIGESAFAGGENLTEIALGNGLETINSNAFNMCDLRSITIPVSVTHFGTGIFAWCVYLSNITYNGTKAQWNAINKQETTWGDKWDNHMDAYTIHCTNGDITKA